MKGGLIYQLENEDILVGNLVEKINAELKKRYGKKVIHLGNNEYDYENGRSVVDNHLIQEMLRKETGIVFYSDKWHLCLDQTYLIFKTKRKKSGIYDSETYQEKFTITSIYVENEEILTQTIKEIKQKSIEQKKIRKEQKLQDEDKKKQIFFQSLNGFNLTLKDFKKLLSEYEQLTYLQRKELE